MVLKYFNFNKGDISPTTITEKLFVILMAITGCGVFAFFVNTIDSVIRND